MGLALVSGFGGNKKPVRGLIRPLKILWRKGGMYMYVIYHDHGDCIIYLVIIFFFFSGKRESNDILLFIGALCLSIYLA